MEFFVEFTLEYLRSLDLSDLRSLLLSQAVVFAIGLLVVSDRHVNTGILDPLVHSLGEPCEQLV